MIMNSALNWAFCDVRPRVAKAWRRLRPATMPRAQAIHHASYQASPRRCTPLGAALKFFESFAVIPLQVPRSVIAERLYSKYTRRNRNLQKKETTTRTEMVYIYHTVV